MEALRARHLPLAILAVAVLLLALVPVGLVHDHDHDDEDGHAGGACALCAHAASAFARADVPSLHPPAAPPAGRLPQRQAAPRDLARLLPGSPRGPPCRASRIR